MGRYTGPRRRVVRRLGTRLVGLTRQTAEERAAPPGVHGGAARRRRPSEYAVRLREKQKVRFYYGLTETQLRNYVRRASSQPGPPGENLLGLLERRLDNVVFRLGLAPTVPAARQLIRHGHVTLDGHRASFPAIEVKPGSTIEALPASRAHPLIAEGVQHGPELRLPSYLERSADGFGGRCVASPDRADVPLELDESLIIEFYAR